MLKKNFPVYLLYNMNQYFYIIESIPYGRVIFNFSLITWLIFMHLKDFNFSLFVKFLEYIQIKIFLLTNRILFNVISVFGFKSFKNFARKYQYLDDHSYLWRIINSTFSSMITKYLFISETNVFNVTSGH